MTATVDTPVVPLALRGFTVKHRPWPWLLLAAIFLFGAGMFGLGASEYLAAQRLRAASVGVMARVTETREAIDQDGITVYDVRYAFDVIEASGATRTFTRRDKTGRENLWTGLPRDLWEEAGKTGRVAVVYQADDPWNNRLAEGTAAPTGDSLTAMFVLGILPMGVAVLAAIGVLMELRDVQKKSDEEIAGTYTFFRIVPLDDARLRV